MTEIYNFTTYGEPSLTSGGWIFIAVFVFFFIVGIIRLIKYISRPSGIRSLIASLGAIILPIVVFVTMGVLYNNSKENYQKALQLYNSGDYLSEEGALENFYCTELDESDEYHISFTVNGIDVDGENFDNFTDYTFSEDEVDTIRNAKRVKIEYTEAIEDEITILTLSVVNETNEDDGVLTLDKVKELAKKGDALTWSDFEGYPHKDVGSGLYIWEIDIDDNYYLLVGGGNTNQKPDYAYLCSNKSDKTIDIRTADIDNYLSKN